MVKLRGSNTNLRTNFFIKIYTQLLINFLSLRFAVRLKIRNVETNDNFTAYFRNRGNTYEIFEILMPA